MAKTETAVKSPLKESLKELGRIVLFAAVSAAITAGINYLTPLEDIVAWATGITVILRIIDQYLHTKAPGGTSAGLSRF